MKNLRSKFALAAVATMVGVLAAPLSASAATCSVNVTSTDGGARVTGTVSFPNSTTYNYNLTVTDIQADGYGATGLRQPVDRSGGVPSPDYDQTWRALGGKGDSNTVSGTGARPAGGTGVYIAAANGPVGSSQYYKTLASKFCAY